jgi:RNA polymerase sigma-70 factor (ECF subfamily)
LIENIEKLPDKDLVQIAITGVDQAFSEIVKRHKSKIANIIFSMLGYTQEAEDVGQEVFIRFYNSMSNFKGEAELKTYLSRIAINLSLNELKRRKKRRFFSLDKVGNNKSLWYKNNLQENIENKDMVNKSLQRLNPKLKSVLVLRLVNEFSTEETAKILNIPIGTVLSRLARGQEKLRKILSSFMVN